jgi:hypothetical protein
MAEFTVTTLADETFEGSETPAAPDGNGLSLREALGLANANGAAEPDTIKFDASLAGGVLFLQSGELTITTDGITIDGDIDGDGMRTSPSTRTPRSASTTPPAGCS